MDQRTLRKLEYGKILEKLSGYCSFSGSKELAEGLQPALTVSQGETWQKETDEGKELLRLYPTFSLGGVRDIRPALKHISIGGILDIESLVDMADTCRSARLTRSFFSEIKGNFPLTSALGKSLILLKTIETAVEKAIGPDGSINDTASEHLCQVCRKIRITNERFKVRLDSIIHNPNTAKFLQEAIVTIRDNRYVVPVRQEYRTQIPGIVHDVSASGASVFVEPMAVMELNNELQKMTHEEEEEIAAILRSLTMVVAGFAEELTFNLEIMAHLDFIMAKGKFSHQLDGASPKINDKGFINLQAARHPLINPDLVVPIDIRLDKDISALVITGPNTGGKTVTLKTVGLLTVMGLCGLHIPAKNGSEICYFSQIFADIGDEQSIEQSLSTFSSHMVNIVDILEKSDEETLVLLDELGAGTDPTEGAALAMAILGKLKKRGAKIVATTHYSELKAFAYNTPGFVNASVEFDIQSLAPTYRLLMGVPGKSNAFEIARRLGIEEEVIDAAAQFLTNEDAQVAELLHNLEGMRLLNAQEQGKNAALALELAEKEKKLLLAAQKIDVDAAEALRKANLKSQKIIDETIARSQKLYEEFKKQAEEEKQTEKAWQQSRKKLKNWQEELEEQLPKRIYTGQAPKSLVEGDLVFIPRINQKATVLASADSNGDVALQVGVLKLMMKLEELRLADDIPEGKDEPKSKRSDFRMEKAAKIQNEIHLRGMEVSEALDVLDKYLDDAFVAGLKSVRIVHGKGTGTLRAAVAKYLQKHRLVKDYRIGDFNEGGMGVTIAELDI